MPQNRVQYQEGFSLSDFIQAFGTEDKCLAALEDARCPNGFRCPQCGAAESFCVINDGRRKRYQCKSCRHQTTATAGTKFDPTKLPLVTWFQVIYLITHAKNGISAMEIRQQLGVSYLTGWRIKHKLMQAMQERDSQYLLQGIIHIDDAYFGGELSGGKADRGSENRIPFVAAVELNNEGRPIHIKMNRVSGFTSEAIKTWTKTKVVPGSAVFSDGLGCFRATADAGCEHVAEIMGGRKPKEVPILQWLNTIMGNVKTGLSGTYHAFKFQKYGDRYLAEIAYRFNRRFNLKGMLQRLLIACIGSRPQPERLLRSA